MTGTARLAATLLGAAVMLSALSAGGQPSSQIADGTRQDTSSASDLTVRRAPADLPPNPPKVTCDGGQLTISAQNSTLGAVLNAIGACSGAQIDVPEEVRAERLFAELGPGPVRAVLAEFLSSTDFNYVIKASPSDPQKVQMVLLNPRTIDSATEGATIAASGTNVTPNRRGWLKARENYMKSFTAANDEASQPADTAPSAAEPVETAVAPAASAPADSGAAPSVALPVEATGPSASSVPAGADPVGPAPSVPVSSPSANPMASSGSDAPQSQGKSTQEMISDMQRMFEQRKQMNQQQAATPPHP